DALSVARVLEDALVEISGAGIDTAQYLEREFGPGRREMQQALARALAQGEPASGASQRRRRRLMAAGAALATALLGVAVWSNVARTRVPAVTSARTALQAAAMLATEIANRTSPRTTSAPASVARPTPASRPTRARAERKRGTNAGGGNVRLWEWQ
ncbi:MAG TPA: hypothetical protein VK524_31930, partial [Polyangiaceae bacterium]|nr:hypothetical protein [Polyangiaceae bacterium]